MATDQSNRISLNIPAADMQDILAGLQAMLEKLRPHLVDLNVEERHALPKMGTRTVDFVGKALQYARDNPEFTPAFFDVDEFARDFAAVDTLRSLQRPLSQLADMVDDSLLLSGSEAYGSALSYYQSIKTAAKRGLPGAALIADDLGTQFQGRGPRAIGAPARATSPVPAPTTQPPVAT
jgi:hypothetical protein